MIAQNAKTFQLASTWKMRAVPETSTPTFSKSSGGGSVSDGAFQRMGPLCQLTFKVANGASDVTAGNNAWVGSVNVALPAQPISAVGYSGGTCLVAYMDVYGTITVRVTGATWPATYDSSRIALTYFTAN